MKTFTNELSINCNNEAIDNKYDIYHIKTNDNYIQRGSRVLDLGLNGIRSIAFDDGASVFILFKKHSVKSFELQEIVGDELMVKKISASELKPYILARLFLFSLSNSDYDDYAFSNLTGKLYLFKSEWISSSRKSFKALNIDIKSFGDNSSKMICSACTFTLTKSFKSPKIVESYPHYVFSVKGTLRRTFEKDDNSYIKRNKDGKKAEVPFISFVDGKTQLTKTYLLLSLIDRFNRSFEGMIHLELKEKEIVQKLEAKKDGPIFDKVVELFIGQTICMVNMIETSEDAGSFTYMADRIQEMLPLTNIVISKEIVKKEMNIVLIHDQVYYKENDLKDPYASFDRSTPIQCVTLEDACYQDSDVIYKTILKELEIKNEIINDRRIRIDNWKAYEHNSSFIFGIMQNNLAYFININPLGEFKLIKKSDAFSSFKESIYINLERILFSIKGDDKIVVADDKGNINLILDSGLIPLPRKELFSSTSLRSNESKENNLAGVLDVNVYHNDEFLQYSSGPIGKTLNKTIPVAPHIYNVLVKNGDEIMTSLIETLGVQFVKNNSFTVIPYPFKYLREWIQMQVQSKN